MSLILSTIKASLVPLLMLLCLSSGHAGNVAEYRSDILCEISKAIGLTPEWGRSDTTRIIKYKNRDVAYRIENDEIGHIGYRIFTDSLHGHIPQVTRDFVERYWLELTLPMERLKTVETQMAEDGFRFVHGNLGSIDAIQSQPSLTLSACITPHRASMLWGDPEAPVCTIEFPINQELILGQKMIERDRRLPEQIAKWQCPDSIAPQCRIEELTPSDSIEGLQVQNQGSYLTEYLAADRYFTIEDGNVMPVFEPAFLCESLKNLFSGIDIPQAKNISLHLRHQIFGLKEQIIDTDVRQWVGCCLAQGCKPYTGVISIGHEGENLADMLIIMHNEAAGYNHVLRLTIDIESVASGQGQTDGRLNAYVPSSNIKNLFKDQQ